MVVVKIGGTVVEGELASMISSFVESVIGFDGVLKTLNNEREKLKKLGYNDDDITESISIDLSPSLEDRKAFMWINGIITTQHFSRIVYTSNHVLNFVDADRTKAINELGTKILAQLKTYILEKENAQLKSRIRELENRIKELQNRIKELEETRNEDDDC